MTAVKTVTIRSVCTRVYTSVSMQVHMNRCLIEVLSCINRILLSTRSFTLARAGTTHSSYSKRNTPYTKKVVAPPAVAATPSAFTEGTTHAYEQLYKNLLSSAEIIPREKVQKKKAFLTLN
jgi:hypothetical protein